MMEAAESRQYYLHEHISTCYMFLDEALKDVSHNKHSNPLKLIVSERWYYDNCGAAPPFVIDNLKYVEPSKTPANKPS
jgi:hypothetical protein